MVLPKIPRGLSIWAELMAVPLSAPCVEDPVWLSQSTHFEIRLMPASPSGHLTVTVCWEDVERQRQAMGMEEPRRGEKGADKQVAEVAGQVGDMVEVQEGGQHGEETREAPLPTHGLKATEQRSLPEEEGELEGMLGDLVNLDAEGGGEAGDAGDGAEKEGVVEGGEEEDEEALAQPRATRTLDTRMPSAVG